MARVSYSSITQVDNQADAYSSNIAPCITIVNYVPQSGYTSYTSSTATSNECSSVWMTVRYVCGFEMLVWWVRKEIAALRRAFWR